MMQIDYQGLVAVIITVRIVATNTWVKDNKPVATNGR